MNDFESALSTALRAEAEEISMNVDLNEGAEVLSDRLDEADRSKRRTTWIRAAAGVLAGAAVVAIIAFGVNAARTHVNSDAVSPTVPRVTSVGTFGVIGTFGVPLSVELPPWARGTGPTYHNEEPADAIWNRCPDGGSTECIGLQFDRIGTVGWPKSIPVTYSSYIAYLHTLAAQGKINVSDSLSTTVDGRPALVMSIVSPVLDNGLGCHSRKVDVLNQCVSFQGVPGRYAVVDTGSLDPDHQVMVIWTDAGAVAAAEEGWLEQFDHMLTTVRFIAPTPSSS
jgi:hypothetical protein